VTNPKDFIVRTMAYNSVLGNSQLFSDKQNKKYFFASFSSGILKQISPQKAVNFAPLPDHPTRLGAGFLLQTATFF
jgi:hypothetical protein